MIIACLTTTPNRADEKTLKPCIERLASLGCIDLIVLNVPKVMKRTGKPYDIEKIRKIVERVPKVFLNVVDEDDGPILKLSGVLDVVPWSKDNYIMVLDDDVMYNLHAIQQRIIRHLQNDREAATALMGRSINTSFVREGPSDVLEGVSTIMARRDLLPKSRLDLQKFIQRRFPNDPEIGLTDDLIISAWFQLNGVPKLVYRIHYIDEYLATDDSDALYITNFQSRNKKNFNRYKHYFPKRINVLLMLFAVVVLGSILYVLLVK